MQRFLRVAVVVLLLIVVFETGIYAYVFLQKKSLQQEIAVPAFSPEKDTSQQVSRIPEVSKGEAFRDESLIDVDMFAEQIRLGDLSLWSGAVGVGRLVSRTEVETRVDEFGQKYGIEEYVFKRRVNGFDNYFRIRGAYGSRGDLVEEPVIFPWTKQNLTLEEGSVINIVGLQKEINSYSGLSNHFKTVLQGLETGSASAINEYFMMGTIQSDWPIEQDGIVDLRGVAVVALVQQ